MKRNAEQNGEAVFRLGGVSAWYEDLPVLRDLQFQIPEASVTCLTGPSGSGKSTLLNLLVRLDAEIEGLNWEGEMRFKGRSLDDLKDLPALRRRIGLVGQKPTIFPGSVERNVLFGVRERMKKDEREEMAARYLKKAHLYEEVADRMHQDASKLSSGQQQRLCIARALAVEPEVLMLDEPTASLDPASCRAIEEMMNGIGEERTVVFVTHDEDQADRLGDYRIHLQDGECIQQELFVQKSPESHSGQKGQAYKQAK